MFVFNCIHIHKAGLFAMQNKSWQILYVKVNQIELIPVIDFVKQVIDFVNRDWVSHKIWPHTVTWWKS